MNIFICLLLSIGIIHGKFLNPAGPSCPQGDGFYAVGCSSFFLQCVHGVEYELSCPEGLYFDRLLARCERRSNNLLCEKKFKFSNTRQKAFEMKCENDGNFAIENLCISTYYQCSNGKGFMRKCPYNQVFNENSNRCDYPGTCVEENESRIKNEGAAHIRKETITTEIVEQIPNGIDCTQLENATISKYSCSKFFFQCAQGTLYRKYCPSDLVYDIDRNLCDYPDKTKGCPSADQILKTPNYPFLNEQSSTSSTTTTTTTTTEIPSVLDGNCSSRADGFYVTGYCQETFISCVGGFSKTFKCADKLVYDPRIDACDYPEACQAKREDEPIPNLFEHGGLKVENKTNVEEKVDFSCANKTNGYYIEKPCSSKYLLCDGEKLFVLNCPALLVFNIITNTCDYKENCKRQQLETTTTTTLEVEPTTTFSKVDELTPTSVVQSEASEVLLSTTITPPQSTTSTISPCTNRDNGNYPISPCNTQFYQCWNGQYTITTCPSNLVYNSYKGQCDYKHHSSGCKPSKDSVASTTSIPTTTLTTSSILSTLSTSTTEKTETDGSYDTTTEITNTTEKLSETTPSENVNVPIDPFCDVLADGIYGFACNSFFIQCINSETYKIRCPSGLFYNTATVQCDYRENITACVDSSDQSKSSNLTTTTTTTTTSATTTSTTNSQQLITEQVSTTPITSDHSSTSQNIPFSCTGRVDGIYALPYCTSEYVQCVNGHALINSCSPELFYSEQTGLCDYRHRVENCKKEQQNFNSIENNLCVGKADSYYSNGCSSHYYSCINNQVRKMICPSNLKFSGEKGLCDYPFSIEECNTHIPIHSPPAVNNDFCNHKISGLYAYSLCSPHYVVCDNGAASAGTCASPLVFNQATELCEYKTNNVNCPQY